MVGVPVFIERLVIPWVTPAGELPRETSEKPSVGAAFGACIGICTEPDEGNCRFGILCRYP